LKEAKRYLPAQTSEEAMFRLMVWRYVQDKAELGTSVTLQTMAPPERHFNSTVWPGGLVFDVTLEESGENIIAFEPPSWMTDIVSAIQAREKEIVQLEFVSPISRRPRYMVRYRMQANSREEGVLFSRIAMYYGLRAGLTSYDIPYKKQQPLRSCLVCGDEDAAYLCGQCHDESYCGKACQQWDWEDGQHRLQCVEARKRGRRHKGKGLSAQKAKEILRDGTVHGQPLTEKQKRYFGWLAGGRK
jgi:MYND finger